MNALAHLQRDTLRNVTRRHFLRECTTGLGALWLATQGRAAPAPGVRRDPARPLAPLAPQFPARAKHVIYLHMAGAPSQLELFHYRPELAKLHGQDCPREFLEGKRFAFMDSFTKEHPRCLGSRRMFARHGKAGTYVSECLPYTAGIADDIAVIRTLATNVFNHAPAKFFMNSSCRWFISSRVRSSLRVAIVQT